MAKKQEYNLEIECRGTLKDIEKALEERRCTNNMALVYNNNMCIHGNNRSSIQ